jgi:hypothetical protein
VRNASPVATLSGIDPVVDMDEYLAILLNVTTPNYVESTMAGCVCLRSSPTETGKHHPPQDEDSVRKIGVCVAGGQSMRF